MKYWIVGMCIMILAIGFFVLMIWNIGIFAIIILSLIVIFAAYPLGREAINFMEDYRDEH